MKTAKLVSILTVIIALILLVVQNTSPVLARFLWFSAEMPAIMLLLLTAVGGFALGILVVLFMRSGTNPNHNKGGELSKQE